MPTWISTNDSSMSPNFWQTGREGVAGAGGCDLTSHEVAEGTSYIEVAGAGGRSQKDGKFKSQ